MTKVVTIPGWMDTGKSYGLHSEVLEVWCGQDMPTHIEAGCLVAYSFGATLALLAWQCNPRLKLILVNPIIPRKSMPQLLWSWVRFILYEGTHLRSHRLASFAHLYSNFRKAISLAKVDTLELASKVPREKLVILRGAEDKYLFDAKSAELVRGQGINVIEVPDVGHLYRPTLDKVIGELCQSND